MASSVKSLKQKTKEEKISGIFFDGKQDRNTKLLKYDEMTGRFHPDKVMEEHYTITQEPQGKYLFHFTPNVPDEGENPADQIAQGLHERLLDYGADESLVMISGDSTNTNTGWSGGTMALLKKMLGHK